jgi:DNA-binding transcriptional LysR family regulator
MSTPRDPLERFFNATLRLSHLRTLAALAQLGQVRKVAEHFHVTQSAISKQIAEIEAGLGELVVRREGNGVVLTPIGQRLTARAADVLQQLDRTRHEIAALRTGLSGRLVLGAVSTVNATLMPKAIALLRERAPNVSLALNEDSADRLLSCLLDRSIDLAVIRMWHPVMHDSLSHRVLMDEPLAVVARAGHPLLDMPGLAWPMLMAYPWCIPKRGSPAHGALAALLAGHGLRIPDGAVESISIMLNLALLADGDFLALLPRRLAARLADEGRVVVLPLDTGGLLSEARVFWRTEENDATQSLFVDCLLQASQDV